MRHSKLMLSLFVGLIAVPISAQVAPNFNGDFQSELRFSAGVSPSGVAIGDLNGDGRADVVVADYNGFAVNVLIGNGDGTLRSPTSYPTGDYTYAVALADLNGDGHLDIVCANLNLNHLTLGGTVSVLLGNGDGTFAPAVNYVAGKNLSSIVLADFNADGHIDIATSDVSSGNVAILLNNGNGTFQPATQYAAGPNPFSLAAADFNGDGKIDLAVTNYCDVSGNFICSSYASTVTVVLGHGDGTFGSPATYQAGLGPFDLVAYDFNADGKSDLAVSNYPGVAGSISLLLGNGDGSFQPPVSFPAGPPGARFALGDFDGDGVSDLIVASQAGLAELRGKGAGGFDAAVSYFVPLNLSGGAIAVGDLNGDGRPDVVAVDQNVIGVFLNAGGTTRQPTSIAVTSSQNPALATSTLTITASVMPAGASLQGSVTFYIDGQAVPDVPPLGQLNSSNQATALFLHFPSGTHAVAAIYSGDTTTQGSTGNVLMQTVTAVPTATTISSNPDPSLNGLSVTLLALVTQSFPDGSVTFFDGTNALGTVPVSTYVGSISSFATLSVSNLMVGTHSISAAFGNGIYFAPSVSGALQQVVNGNLNLAVAPGSQNSATVSAGNPAQFVLNIGGAGYSGSTTVTCTEFPLGAACSVMPANLILSATNVSTINVSMTTTPRSSTLRSPPSAPASWLLAVVLFGFATLLWAKRTTKLETSLSRACLVFATLLISSCGSGSLGGSSSGGGNPNGTPAGTYNITVTATSGSTVDSTSLVLTVR